MIAIITGIQFISGNWEEKYSVKEMKGNSSVWRKLLIDDKSIILSLSVIELPEHMKLFVFSLTVIDNYKISGHSLLERFWLFE